MLHNDNVIYYVQNVSGIDLFVFVTFFCFIHVVVYLMYYVLLCNRKGQIISCVMPRRCSRADYGPAGERGAINVLYFLASLFPFSVGLVVISSVRPGYTLVSCYVF